MFGTSGTLARDLWLRRVGGKRGRARARNREGVGVGPCKGVPRQSRKSHLTTFAEKDDAPVPPKQKGKQRKISRKSQNESAEREGEGGGGYGVGSRDLRSSQIASVEPASTGASPRKTVGLRGLLRQTQNFGFSKVQKLTLRRTLR